MARKDLRRSQQWHFSDSGSRLSRRRRYTPEIDPNPISKTFTRKILYCKRCGSRVVSNVSHCPYCGKNILPLYQRLYFWMVFVVVIAAGATVLVLYSPQVNFEVPEVETPMPTVVGAAEGHPIKNLSVGTTVDCDNLLVTVLESSQTITASNGRPIIAVKVQFNNKGQQAVMLYLTQWQLETDSGERVDSVPMKTVDNQTITSELDTVSLPPGSTLTATLYFAADNLALVVFAPQALDFSEDRLVTWRLASTDPAAGTEDGQAEGDQAATEPA